MSKKSGVIYPSNDNLVTTDVPMHGVIGLKITPKGK